MINHDAAAELEQLAAQVARIRPMSDRNPHAFYEERSEVASKMRELALKLRGCPPSPVRPDDAKPQAQHRSAGRVQTHEVRHIGGRTIVVLLRRDRPAAGVR